MSISRAFLSLLVALTFLSLSYTIHSAWGQLQTGNLYGVVFDSNGSPLPGVTTTLSGLGAPQIQVSNAQGQVRFLGLSPGLYSLLVELEGFASNNTSNIAIDIGRNTEIEVTLTPAVEDTITTIN